MCDGMVERARIEVRLGTPLPNSGLRTRTQRGGRFEYAWGLPGDRERAIAAATAFIRAKGYEPSRTCFGYTLVDVKVTEEEI